MTHGCGDLVGHAHGQVPTRIIEVRGAEGVNVVSMSGDELDERVRPAERSINPSCIHLPDRGEDQIVSTPR